MEEQLVSLEVARLLEEKGFCNGSAYCYDNFKQELHRNGNDSIYINGLEEDYIEVPTQSLVQKWIREKGIHIGVYANASGWGWILTKCGGNGSCIKEIEDDTFFDTYEDALEEGLKQALKLI